MVCVGLDTSPQKIPEIIHLVAKEPVSIFNTAIINKTGNLICAIKLNIAFFAAQDSEGEEVLKKTIEYIHISYPDIPVILDAKRSDIGKTCDEYVKEVFGRYQADAVTVNPYLGRDACQPFLDQKNKGVIVLCRTSNPGAGDFQDLPVEFKGRTIPLYQAVAIRVAQEWNTNGNCLLVMGATYPKQLKIVRELVGDMPFLVPGIGSQGGDIRETVINGQDSKGAGMIINSSSGIIYKSSGSDFDAVAAEETMKLRDEINKWRLLNAVN